MPDEFKTLREVGHALGGIRTQLALMTGVFVCSVGIGLGGMAFLYNKLGSVADTGSRIEAKLDSIEKLLAETRASSQKVIEDLGRIKGALRLAGVDQPTTGSAGPPGAAASADGTPTGASPR